MSILFRFSAITGLFLAFVLCGCIGQDTDYGQVSEPSPENNTTDDSSASASAATKTESSDETKDFEGRTVEETFARFASACKANDLTKFSDTLSEPWASAFPRLAAMALEINKHHVQLQEYLDSNFDSTELVELPTEQDQLIDQQIVEIRNSMSLNSIAGVKNVRLVEQSPVARTSPIFNMDRPLLDLDGIPIAIIDAVELEVEFTLEREFKKEKEKLFALKVVGKDNAVKWTILIAPGIANSRQPKDELQEELERYQQLLTTYQTLLRELKDGLYRSRAEADEVLNGSYQTIFDLIERPLLSHEIPMYRMPSEYPPLHLRIHDDRENNELLFEFDHWTIGVKDLAQRLKAIAGSGNASADDIPWLVLQLNLVDNEAKVTDMLTVILDSGYDRSKIAIDFHDDRFTLSDFENLSKKLRGRHRLFARLPENSSRFNLEKVDVDPSSDLIPENPQMLDDASFLSELTELAEAPADIDAVANPAFDFPLQVDELEPKKNESVILGDEMKKTEMKEAEQAESNQAESKEPEKKQDQKAGKKQD